MLTDIKTLESEVKEFAEGLPYWAKYLASKILTGSSVLEDDIKKALVFLLEELKVAPESEKSTISFTHTNVDLSGHKTNLLFEKLEEVEGVNALCEEQAIIFSANLTILFWTNGSGKSWYSRLLKKAFYSKAPEEIIKNIHLESGHKAISAKFGFKIDNTTTVLNYPEDASNPIFEQFAVFDWKSVLKHLKDRNEFEFRPEGLLFFSEFNEAVNKVEEWLKAEIEGKQKTLRDFSELFDGESVIKLAIKALTAISDISELKKHTELPPWYEEKKQELDKNVDTLRLVLSSKDGSIKKLEQYKTLLLENKEKIEKINTWFNDDILLKIRITIEGYVKKLENTTKESIDNFKTDAIQEIWTTEWKDFIIAAGKFAEKQYDNEKKYPENGDYCLLCHQPLSEDAQKLISSYWSFIASVAEEELKKARDTINKGKMSLSSLNFDIFPLENILTEFLIEKYPTILESVKVTLSEQKTLSELLISDLDSGIANIRTSIQTGVTSLDVIINEIEKEIKVLNGDIKNVELDKLTKEKTFFVHKDKLILQFEGICTNLKTLKWIASAESYSFKGFKAGITNKEKRLSETYFNQKYIDQFNQECTELNGSFGVSIDSRSSDGKSNRQLLVKWKSPLDILSEGEQKVIALADFLSEIQLSEVNKGIIFDDPVNSLDNERKKQVAERLVKEAKNRQVIIFTHDLVFFYHIKNFSKSYFKGVLNSLVHHTIEKEASVRSWKVILNSSPATEWDYNNPTKAKEWLLKCRATDGKNKCDYAKSGLSSLRASYEALAIFTILGGTVQRFDPQIRMGRLKDIKFEKSLIEEVVWKYGEISDIIEWHLQSDEFWIIPSPEILEAQILEFESIKERIKSIS